MAIEEGDIETISFDSFTTLVDVIGSTSRALESHVDDPAPVVDLWRRRALDYRMVVNQIDLYETYFETTRHALAFALHSHGHRLDNETVDDIASVFYRLDVFEDVLEAFNYLDGLNYDIYIVSNGTRELLETMVERAAIDPYIDGIFSADEIEVYKPRKDFYQSAAKTLDYSLPKTVHIASPWYDILGAKNAGMKTIWLNRGNGPWEELDGAPDVEVESLLHLRDIFH